MILLTGRVTDVLRPAGGVPVRAVEARNLIVDAATDLMAALLASRPGQRGLTYWAVGAGDPAWDQAPVAPERTATALVDEIYRKPLDRDQVVYNPADQTITIRVSFVPGEATGNLREFGVFGGDASAWPGSGTLVSCRRHPLVIKGPDDTLDRELRIQLERRAGQTALLHLVGGLLADDPGSAGIRTWAFGSGDAAWDQAPPQPDPAASSLVREVYRKPLDPDLDIRYVPHQRTLVFRTTLGTLEADDRLREFGLFGGADADRRGGGLLVDHRVHPVIDKSLARTLQREYRLQLAESPAIEVPDLSRATLAEARARLDAAGLTVGAIGEAEREAAAEEGRVVGQQPPPAARAVPRIPVALTIGVPPRVTVPLLLGIPRDRVAAVLAQASLQLGSTVIVQSERPKGTVVGQVPRPGERAARGTAVDVTVATPFTVAVPVLAGLSVGEASLVLETVRLRLAPSPFALKQQPDGWGRVVDQDPAPGTSLDVGEAVAVTLATPVEIDAPDLSGRTVDEAAMLLREAAAPVLRALGLPSEPPGLAVGAQVDVETPSRPGSIVAQQPLAAQKVPLYSTVDVSVAVPITGSVPELFGKSQRDAEAALSAAGLGVGRVGLRQDRATPGTVVAQSLKPGTSVPLGTAVDLQIASEHLTEVPVVIGLTRDVARETLLAAGLQLGATTTRSGPERPGTIVVQQPAGGSNAPVGTAVTLVLSSGLVVVPNLVGRPVEDARARLVAAGLVAATGDPEESDLAVDTVVRQRPVAGERVQSGEVVTLQLAVPRRAVVPNLLGQALDQARATAEASGFVLTQAGQQESDEALGTVVRQVPAAGPREPIGTPIAVHLAVPRSTVVPQLVGLAIDEARAMATESELVVTGETLVSAQQARGIVIEQSVAAGIRVTVGTAIQFNVSQGPDVAVPSVIRLSEAQAVEAMQRAGLVAQIAERVITTSHEHGTVIDQNPAAGAFVRPASAVLLRIAQQRIVDPVRRVTVPRLVGQQIDLARSTAEEAGVVMQITKFTAGPGVTRVTQQNPAFGTRVIAGSTVSVTVIGRLVDPDLELERRRPGPILLDPVRRFEP